jgi:hypothetical protein
MTRREQQDLGGRRVLAVCALIALGIALGSLRGSDAP